MELIPAIDLRQGQVVRLEQGDDARRTGYGLDPHRVLEDFAAQGARTVHLVDLDAAFGEAPQRQLIESLARSTDLALELGGGLRERDAIQWAVDQGIARLIIGSLVVKSFDRFAELAAEFSGRLVPALEVKGEALQVAGWRESAAIGLPELCRQLASLPCPAIFFTDVERDGAFAGPNLELAARIHAWSGRPILLSGGMRDLSDLEAAARLPGVAGAIVGKAIYEGRISLGEAISALADKTGGRP